VYLISIVSLLRLEQETLPLLLSTGWFQEQISSKVSQLTKINLGRSQ